MHPRKQQWFIWNDKSLHQAITVKHLGPQGDTPVSGKETHEMALPCSSKQQQDTWNKSETPQWVVAGHLEWHKATLEKGSHTPKMTQSYASEWQWNT